MKNKLIINSLRTIKTFFPRFLSLLIMSLLGVFVFTGLNSTTPDMMNTLDKYFKERNHYDLEVISTMGLEDSDLKYLKNIEGIKSVEGGYSKDILINLEDFYTLSVTSIPENINLIEVTSGDMPKNNNEILVEERLLSENNLNIGDNIVIEDKMFSDSNFKIVGTVSTSLYFNNAALTHSRGNTNVGTGVINYYSYVLESNFNLDYYTNIYISLSNNYKTGTKKYDNLITKNINKLNKIKNTREKNRYDSIYNEALSKVQDEESKVNKDLDDAYNKLNSAKQELDNSKYILDDTNNKLESSNDILINTKNELNNTKNELDNKSIELNNFKSILDSKNNELEQYKNYLEQSEYELNIFKYTLDNRKKELDDSLDIYNAKLEELSLTEELLDNKIEEITNSLELYETDELKELLNTLITLKETKEELDNAYIEYNENLEKYNNSYNELLINKELYNNGLTEYNNNLNTYNESINKYNDGLTTYNNYYSEYQDNLNKYNESKLRYEEGLSKYYNGLSEYNKSLKEYNDNKVKAQEEIKKAYDKLKEIEMPKWYIKSLKDYPTYIEYIDDTNSIKNLSKIFPVLFFSVAILISLISMNRMVENDRLEIGTLKSLGFSNRHILNKYLLFSFLATLIGVIIGGILGSIIIPKMIFSIYKVLFELPDLIISLNLRYTIIGSIVAFICICGTTIYTVDKVLKEKPSELVRPKTPKGGKRILLEKFRLWRKVSFSKKVIIRNILRYKKRVLVTIFGIAGCTSLIVCGFGIKDSIVDIANTQYGKIFTYDGIVYTSDELTGDILENNEIKDMVKIQNISAKVYDSEVNMFISENEEVLKKIVNLNSINGNKVRLENNKVVITEKFATINKLKIGDVVEIVDTDNNTYKYEISDIVENHLGHFIFMDKDTYNNFKYNAIYIKTNELSENQKNILSSKLLKYDNIINIIYVSDLKDSVLNMLKSLDQVVFILIVLASLLAFVVLYNLSNININERKREIATLKVLGFYNKEVDDYITKENILLSILGIIIGLFLGYFITNLVITTVEIEKARFIRGISINSYVYSCIIAISFTFIVNIFTHFTLKKIDMIDSLKSVE